jgi:hypothetical protein
MLGQNQPGYDPLDPTERGKEKLREAQTLGQKAEEGVERLKQEPLTQPAMMRQHVKPGFPQFGVIIAGFPSPIAKELAQHCMQSGINVSNIGLGCKGSTTASKPAEQLEGVSKLEVVDCEAPDVREHLDRARDALEKEGSKVIIVLDVGQDCSSIELYNRLKLPFVHSGSGNLAEELKMYEQCTAANNACVISPFISREGALLQLMFETFARSNPGIFRGWSLDTDSVLPEGNTVAAAFRRSQNAASYLVDQDPSTFSKLSSGKGILSGGDDKQKEEQQQQQEGQQHKEGGGGLMAKLGLTSAAQTVSAAVSSAKGAIAKGTGTPMCRGAFTFRSPDGKHSFNMSHEHQSLANVASILQMAEFLTDKIESGRQPRVWGVKDWVPGIDVLNRQLAENCVNPEHCQGQQQQQQHQHGQKVGRQIPASMSQHKQQYEGQNVSSEASSSGNYPMESSKQSTGSTGMGSTGMGSTGMESTGMGSSEMGSTAMGSTATGSTFKE